MPTVISSGNGNREKYLMFNEGSHIVRSLAVQIYWTTNVAL